MELKQLIRQYPELGDVFADFEGRLLYLENSQLPELPEEPISISKDDEPLSKKRWDIINQLRAEVKHLSSKVNEMRASASKRKPKYKEYIKE